MTDASGRFTITYNGELYNYVEVREELRRGGAAFRSSSDTEVLLEAYKQWGTDCLSRFNGMFAFAIYDSLRDVVFCARDRYGEKPFLYAEGSDWFVFASEYKALLQHPQVPVDHDEWRLVQAAQNPSTGLDADEQTVFTAVRQLLPAHAMEIHVPTLRKRVWRYWGVEPLPSDEAMSEQDAFARFRELLVDAVRIRLRSDVEVGSCLSGGLDSSTIVGIVRDLVGRDASYHTFTGRFPGTPADEWEYARLVIERSGVHSHVVEPTVDSFLDDAPRFLWYNELPVGSSSQFAQWCVFRLAKDHGITVLLDGQGADELLGGYEQYFGRYVEALKERGDWERLMRELPLIRERYPLALAPRTRAVRDRLPLSVRHRLSGAFGLGTSPLYGLRRSVAAKVLSETTVGRLAGFNPLTSALVQDSFGRFLTVLLRYGDRNSMAHSREVRLPFCDHRLAEFVFRLPPHLIMGGVQTKRLLREAGRGLMPESIRTRWNKQGFRPPQERWFSSPRMLAAVRDTFSSRSFHESPYWEAKWWLAATDRLERGESALAWAIWQPFITEQWRTHFLARVAEERARVRHV